MKNVDSKIISNNGETASEAGRANAIRYGIALPAAGVVTVALTLCMAGFIATEFIPQEKLSTASYEINPQVEDIPDPERLEKPDPLKEVETPPPPPRIATDDAAAVDLPVIKVVGNVTEFEMREIDFGQSYKSVPIDKDPVPLVRIPPVFPTRFLQGDVSGYCRVRFDISPEGLPLNVETTVCTDKQLRSATVKSVQKWKYAPQIENGLPVTRTGLNTTIRFDLQGDRGETLPLPSGI